MERRVAMSRPSHLVSPPRRCAPAHRTAPLIVGQIDSFHGLVSPERRATSSSNDEASDCSAAVTARSAVMPAARSGFAAGATRQPPPRPRVGGRRPAAPASRSSCPSRRAARGPAATRHPAAMPGRPTGVRGPRAPAALQSSRAGLERAYGQYTATPPLSRARLSDRPSRNDGTMFFGVLLARARRGRLLAPLAARGDDGLTV